MIGRSAVTRSDLMRVSHSWTPKLNILEILTHFWPASEPCRQATINDMDFMFPVPALPSFTCPPCKYEGMDMHSSTNLGTINLVIYGSKCPILNGVHQTARPTNGLLRGWFIVDFHVIGRSTCAITGSDLVQVSHSGSPNLNILEIIKHLWPASEPCRQATINDMDFIFPVPVLPSLT